jgi:hypothetical protein
MQGSCCFGGHFSGNSTYRPAVLKNADSLIGIHKLSPFRLRKALGDLDSKRLKSILGCGDLS